MKNRKNRDDFFPPVPWWFFLVWGIIGVAGLSIVGVVVWAIIRFVLEFTG